MIDSFGRPDLARTLGDGAQDAAALTAGAACATEAPALAYMCASFASDIVGGLEDVLGGGSDCSGWVCDQATPEDWAGHMTPGAINQVNAAFNAIPAMQVLVALPQWTMNFPAGTFARAYLSKMYETFVRGSLTKAEIDSYSKLADCPAPPPPDPNDLAKIKCLSYLANGMTWKDGAGCVCEPPGVFTLVNGAPWCTAPGAPKHPHDEIDIGGMGTGTGGEQAGGGSGDDGKAEGHGLLFKGAAALLAAGAVYAGVQYARGKPVMPPAAKGFGTKMMRKFKR